MASGSSLRICNERRARASAASKARNTSPAVRKRSLGERRRQPRTTASRSLGTFGFLLLGATADAWKRANAARTGEDGDSKGSSPVSIWNQTIPNEYTSLAVV